MNPIIVAAIGLLGLAFILALVRTAFAPDDATRVVAAEVITLSGVSAVAVVGSTIGVSVLFDVVALLMLGAVLTTIAGARLLVRGRR